MRPRGVRGDRVGRARSVQTHRDITSVWKFEEETPCKFNTDKRFLKDFLYHTSYKYATSFLSKQQRDILANSLPSGKCEFTVPFLNASVQRLFELMK